VSALSYGYEVAPDAPPDTSHGVGQRDRWLAACAAVSAWWDLAHAGNDPDYLALCATDDYARLVRAAAGGRQPRPSFGSPRTMAEGAEAILAAVERTARVAHERAAAADRLLALVRAAADAADPSVP
jgi:hypothetical protein